MIFSWLIAFFLSSRIVSSLDEYSFHHTSGKRFQGSKLIGDPEINEITYMIHFTCTEEHEMTFRFAFVDEDGASQHYSINGVKGIFQPSQSYFIASMLDKVRGDYRVRLLSQEEYVKDRTHYYYQNLPNLDFFRTLFKVRCPFDVFEAKAAFTYQGGNKFTLISEIPSHATEFKVWQNTPSDNQLCVGVAFRMLWGDTEMTFGLFSDGVTFFEHPLSACNGILDSPSVDSIIIRVQQIGDIVRLAVRKESAVEWHMHELNLYNSDLSRYLQYLKISKSTAYNSIGIWHRNEGNVHHDILYDQLVRPEEILTLSSIGCICDLKTSMRCEYTIAGYRCVCKDGYHNPDGRPELCEDRDECGQSSTARCDERTSECRNIVGGFKCACKEGFTEGPSNSCVAVQNNNVHGATENVNQPKTNVNQAKTNVNQAKTNVDQAKTNENHAKQNEKVPEQNQNEQEKKKENEEKEKENEEMENEPAPRFSFGGIFGGLGGLLILLIVLAIGMRAVERKRTLVPTFESSDPGPETHLMSGDELWQG